MCLRTWTMHTCRPRSKQNKTSPILNACNKTNNHAEGWNCLWADYCDFFAAIKTTGSALLAVVLVEKIVKLLVEDGNTWPTGGRQMSCNALGRQYRSGLIKPIWLSAKWHERGHGRRDHRIAPRLPTGSKVSQNCAAPLFNLEQVWALNTCP